jgi:hypothetical protein
MSNSLAIAATTATLRQLLDNAVPQLDASLSDLTVTTQPLDQARQNVSTAQLNLFLYQVSINAAWRNMDMPRQVRPGETGLPPLALNLQYLLTAYGRAQSDNDAVSHRALGGAMSVLHDNPVLQRSAIRLALANNDLAEQFEQVKITMLPLGIEEMSKLWTTFQTQYRASVAFEATVVLIDSNTGPRSALPVLRRGSADRGPQAVAGRGAALNAIKLPSSQSAARLGEDITILGEELTRVDAKVRFSSTRLTAPIELNPPATGDSSKMTVHIPSVAEDPAAMAAWAPGFYTVALVIRPTGAPVRVSNELSFALAPRITVAAVIAGTSANLTVTCTPRIAAGQRVFALFGDRQVAPQSTNTPSDPQQPTTLTFAVPDVLPGTYVVRLRVDGVDSIPVTYAGTPPLPSFDAAQQVTVP